MIFARHPALPAFVQEATCPHNSQPRANAPLASVTAEVGNATTE